MKTRYTAIAAYEAPQCRVIEINIQNMVCTSIERLNLDEEEYEF